MSAPRHRYAPLPREPRGLAALYRSRALACPVEGLATDAALSLADGLALWRWHRPGVPLTREEARAADAVGGVAAAESAVAHELAAQLGREPDALRLGALVAGFWAACVAQAGADRTERYGRDVFGVWEREAYAAAQRYASADLGPVDWRGQRTAWLAERDAAWRRMRRQAGGPLSREVGWYIHTGGAVAAGRRAGRIAHAVADLSARIVGGESRLPSASYDRRWPVTVRARSQEAYGVAVCREAVVTIAARASVSAWALAAGPDPEA